MSRRTQEGPMDFEYQNGTGPMDARSPFAMIGANVQRTPGAGLSSRTPYKKSDSYNSFGTPAHTSHAQPRHAVTQPSSPNKERALPAYNALFSTPHRNSSKNIDDSSAGETPKSPNRDDSDATPDTTALQSAVKKFDWQSMPSLPANINTMERKSPDRRDSFFGRLKSKFNSPGRGEVPRGDLTHVKENRIRKQKSRDIVRHRRHRRNSVSSSASDDDNRRSRSPRKSPRKVSSRTTEEAGVLGQLFSFLAKHPTIPHILVTYAQAIHNIGYTFLFAYVLYRFHRMIQGDIDQHAWRESADIAAEITACKEHYDRNGCGLENRVPALERVCSDWAICIARDPMKVARAHLTIATYAELANAFVDKISYKTMGFAVVLIISVITLTNHGFTLLRQTAHTAPQQWQAPPTPHRTMSGEGMFHAGTPWHAANTIEPSTGYDQIEGRGSPVRRLHY